MRAVSFHVYLLVHDSRSFISLNFFHDEILAKSPLNANEIVGFRKNEWIFFNRKNWFMKNKNFENWGNSNKFDVECG